MRIAVIAVAALAVIFASGCDSDDSTTTIELRGGVPGGLVELLGSDADAATEYGCVSRVSPDSDVESAAAYKCTVMFGDVTRKFVRTSGGEWKEIEP